VLSGYRGIGDRHKVGRIPTYRGLTFRQMND
jgi:hypothetical protein